MEPKNSMEIVGLPIQKEKMTESLGTLSDTIETFWLSSIQTPSVHVGFQFFFFCSIHLRINGWSKLDREVDEMALADVITQKLRILRVRAEGGYLSFQN